MTLVATLLAASEELHALPMPPIAYGGIALAVFLVLGVVTWSYRDVSNRQSSRRGTGAGHDAAGHDAAGH